MAEMNLENVHDAIVGSTVTTEGGDVIVNGQKVTNIFYSAQYQELQTQFDACQERFAKTQRKIEKYPDDEDFKIELLQIDAERGEVQTKLDDLKSEVIRLAETFTKIPINTERLRLARQHFETGDYGAARAILDAEQMGGELDTLLREKEQLHQRQAENETRLIDKANEFLILARLTAVDFALPGRFEKTVEYFEQSLKAAHTLENTFEYAYFLQQHNQFNAALPRYEAALGICRTLAEANPRTYLPKVATTLNNLAVLRADKNQFPEAEAAYQEALGIRRTLAEANPQTYLPDVAMTAVNTSTFYLESVPDREKSLSYARQALLAALPFGESVPSVQNNVRKALRVSEAWGLDAEAFCEETIRAAQEVPQRGIGAKDEFFEALLNIKQIRR